MTAADVLTAAAAGQPLRAAFMALMGNKVRVIRVYVRWTPHPVIVTKGIIGIILGSSFFLLYHYYRVGGRPKV